MNRFLRIDERRKRRLRRMWWDMTDEKVFLWGSWIIGAIAILLFAVEAAYQIGRRFH